MSPAFLLHLCEAANYALCGITSIFEAHAGRQVLLDAQAKPFSPTHHSYLKAITGSTREARRAGKNDANSATASISTLATASVAMSL